MILTGGNPRASVTEAHAMRGVALAEGVPGERIHIEDAASRTLENARFTAALMQRNGWRRALVVTDGPHTPRAIRCFRAAGVTADAHGAPGLFGDAGLFPGSALILREFVAFAWYGAKGFYRPQTHR